jgi:hypothetical protein
MSIAMSIFAGQSVQTTSMEDFGDYIYLIAIVIAGLSSLLKKKKPATMRQDSDMPDLEDVLPETEEEYIPYGEAPNRTQPLYRDEPDWEPSPNSKKATLDKQEERVPVSYETVADFMKLRAKKTVQMKHQFKEEIKTEELDELPYMQLELETAEDVKRAFVYSEIFNRKY